MSVETRHYITVKDDSVPTSLRIGPDELDFSYLQLSRINVDGKVSDRVLFYSRDEAITTMAAIEKALERNDLFE